MLSLSGRLEMSYEACTHRYYDNEERYEVLVEEAVIERFRSKAYDCGYLPEAEFLIQQLPKFDSKEKQLWNVLMGMHELLNCGTLHVVGFEA